MAHGDIDARRLTLSVETAEGGITPQPDDPGSQADAEVDSTPENRNLISAAGRACREADLKRLADTERPRRWEEVALGTPRPGDIS